MSAMAAKFMKRKQNCKHPGFYRHISIHSTSALEGLSLNESNLFLRREFGVYEGQLLASAVKHHLLISGVASPLPGTAEYTKYIATTRAIAKQTQPGPEAAPPSDYIQSGPLARLKSTINLAGYTRPQMRIGQSKCATIRQANSPSYKAIGKANKSIYTSQ